MEKLLIDVNHNQIFVKDYIFSFIVKNTKVKETLLKNL